MVLNERSEKVFNGYYSQEIHGPYEVYDLGDLPLERGGTIRNCKLAYATFGTLSPNKDNAILIPTWYSGTNKIMEQVYVGRGKAIDPDRYFVIIVNQIGNGLSTSPHSTPAPFNLARFPQVSIADDVCAQYDLVKERFGINRLELVTGGSMGAQQTYEWAVRFPEMVKRAAPIAGTAKTTVYDRLMVDCMIDTIVSDPAWNGGWYEDAHSVHLGLRKHARNWAISGLCSRLFRDEVWRNVGFTSLEDFLVGFLENYFLPMDPNSLLSQLWKHQRADVSLMADGDLGKALSRIKAKMFVMPISTDNIFPVADCEAEQKLVCNSELRIIKSSWGHLGLFGMEQEYITQVDAQLRELLAIQV